MADSSDIEEEKDRNFVTALARGLEVLRCFRPSETELGNHDIAERTGLPKPTISRLTHTLCKLDYLVLNPRTGNYRLGPGVLQLGYGVLAGLEIAARASGAMRSLAEGPNSYITCALAERHRFDAIYVAVHRSMEDVSLSMQVGARLPLFFSAIGRAILVGMDPVTRARVRDAGRAAIPDRADEIDAGVERALEDFETRGFCTGYGDWRSDVNGIAVPVHSLDGQRVYGLNVGGPAFHVSAEELERDYAPRLIAAAAELGPVAAAQREM